MAKDLFEKMMETPAKALDKTISGTEALANEVTNKGPLQKAKDYWHLLGPGLTTGASDDDPSGIATYSQTGAKYGYQLLWLSAFTFPMMAVIQELCARIGLVTGRGLASNIRTYFPKWVLYTCTILLFIANTFNLGADLGAMSKAMQLLLPNVSFTVLVVFFHLIVPISSNIQHLQEICWNIKMDGISFAIICTFYTTYQGIGLGRGIIIFV